VYGGNKDLKAVFGDVARFLRYGSRVCFLCCNIMLFVCRWRVAFMEKSIAKLDFETIDQTVQIHGNGGRSFCLGLELLTVSN
jgi:phosphatidylinositol transfer protein SFH5